MEPLDALRLELFDPDVRRRDPELEELDLLFAEPLEEREPERAFDCVDPLEPELRLPELRLAELRLRELPLEPELRLRELPLEPELPLRELPLRERVFWPPCRDVSSFPSSSEESPISFFATPTAAGTATPTAAPATTFFVVDIPSDPSF